jgi:hypothetical protein
MSVSHAIELCGTRRHLLAELRICRQMLRSCKRRDGYWQREWEATRRAFIGNYLMLRACRKGGWS